MISNQWYVILESREVKAGKPIGFTRLGEKMVAWRDSSDKVVVQGDVRPHRGAALHQGKILHDHIMCPFHGFEFDSSGACQYIPANGKYTTPPKILHAKTYKSVERHGYIFIWWGDEQTSYPDLRMFEELESGY
jgi:phenylpropionate dioxygenase-like ring-hydroxylating dioxygenase large terminal subunit